jgi:uncharacterized protein (DUF433 family)
MQLEEYFTFIAPNDIRLKGSRIGIETILYEYIYRRKSPEAISQLYPSLTLEQIYATILYFLQNQETVTQYMADWLNYCRQSAKNQDENPPEHILRLRKIKAERGMI